MIRHRSAVGLLLFASAMEPARAQLTQRVSVGSLGEQATAWSATARTSADGRFAAFTGYAGNLVPGDTNFAPDVFVRDRTAGTTERVSVGPLGAQGNLESGEGGSVSISSDGRFVAFQSVATNLVPGDGNGFRDVFVRDRLLGATERVSLGSGGVEGNSTSGQYEVSISADGRFVAFHSHASNLAAGSGGYGDVFVRDRQSVTTECVSVDALGTGANGASSMASISADGRFVAFMSFASDLVPGDSNAGADMFVRDRQTGTTERVSVGLGGAEASSPSGMGEISGDGRFVVFVSAANNLVLGDTNLTNDVFVHDRQSGTTQRVSVDSSGVQANGDSGYAGATISGDGRHVAFTSVASNLVAGDTNVTGDVFVHDRQTGETVRVSVGPFGAQVDGSSYEPSISADGRWVAFASRADDLVQADTNGCADVFIRDLVVAFAAYCSGDGSAAPCPCANFGANGHGCANSADPQGARLDVAGVPSLAEDTVVLSAEGMPNAAAMYIQGTTAYLGGLGTAFGDGLRCVGGPLVRLGAQMNAGGASQYPEAGQATVSVKGMLLAPGTRTYQAWYRNAAAFCTSGTFNLTNGVEITWSY